MFRAGRSGHASSLGTSLGRGKGEAEASPAGRAHPAHSRGGAGGTKGRPPEGSAPGFKAVTVQKLQQENTPRGPSRGGVGERPARPRPGLPPSDVVRQRARLSALISAPPPARQGDTPIGTRRPQAEWESLTVRIGRAAYPRTNDACLCPRPRPFPRGGRATAPSRRCALRDPRPLRVRGSARLPATAAAACNLRRQDVAGG